MPAPLPNFPATFVSTYVAQGVGPDPLIPPRKKLQLFPKIRWIEIPNRLVWIPQSTIVIMKFDDRGGIEGKIQRNPEGRAEPDLPPLPFDGSYQFAENTDLGVFEGIVRVNLLRRNADGSTLTIRTQILYAVCQDVDTIKFMLRESLLPGEAAPVSADAVVQGVLERVR